MFPWVWGWQFVTFCGVNADKITGTSRQILFEGLPPQTQDLHGFFIRQTKSRSDMILPIRTKRLELRRFLCDDLRAFQSYRCDPELAKYQGWEPTTDGEALDFLSEQSIQAFGPDGQWLQLAVTCMNSKMLIGDIGICTTDSRRGVAEIGFTISQSFQRQGYANEALHGVLSTLFEKHKIQLVVAVTDTRNAPAISLLQGLGFVLANTNEAMFRGELCTEHTFELTPKQWGTTAAG